MYYFSKTFRQKIFRLNLIPQNGEFYRLEFYNDGFGGCKSVLIAFFLRLRIFVVASYYRQRLMILCGLYDFIV